MFLRNIKAFAILILSIAMFGCMGLAHVNVNVPAFEVIGTVVDVENESMSDSALLIAPKFYGSTDALISLLKESLKNTYFYQLQRVDVIRDRSFTAKFNEESRYIGFMVPFAPSKETMESRTIFVCFNKLDTVYRVKLHGNKSIVEKANITELRSSLPTSLRGDTETKWGGPIEKQIREEVDFYTKINWLKTSELRVVDILRNSNLDKLSFELNLKGGS